MTNHKPLLRTLRFEISLGWAALCLITVGYFNNTRLAAQEPLIGAVERVRASRQQTAADPSLPNQIRQTTWQILLGDLASRPDQTLSSGAYDALLKGLADLDAILQKLETDPQSEQRLTQDTQLTMRLDAVVQRRAALTNKRDLSRTAELERLQQLRDLNVAYRDLVRQLVLLNTELLIGRPAEVQKLGLQATQTLARIEEVAGRRRDYYLFQDEPKLDGEERTELNLVRQLMAPIATDVQSHHQSLQALMLNQLALAAPPDVQHKLLHDAAAVATSAVQGHEPTVLALYAQAVGQRELGRLQTRDHLFKQAAHAAAAPHFQAAREAFSQALDLARQQSVAPEFLAELELQSSELSSAERILERADTLTRAGQLSAAVTHLERGLSLQRSVPLILALLEARLRNRDTAGNLEAAIQDIDTEVAVPVDLAEYHLLRGGVRVVTAWSQLNDPQLQRQEQDWRPALTGRLQQAERDLEPISQSTNKLLVAQADVYRALAAAGLLVLEPATPVAAAESLWPKLAAAIEALAEAAPQAARLDEVRIREAILAGRLAQGYLALRIRPDYRDTAQLAFAAAADAASQLPYRSEALQFSGTPVLQSLWNRGDAANLKLAQEERFLRQSLQRFLPAALAMRLAAPGQAADSLKEVIREIEQSAQAWAPDAALTPHETDQGRESLLNEGRVLTVLGLVGADQPSTALRYALLPWYPQLDDQRLRTLPMTELTQHLSTLPDPLWLCVIGLAFEEYATHTLDPRSPQCRGYLKLSLALQQRAAEQLAGGSALNQRYPYLNGMIQSAQSRLSSSDYYLEAAMKLRQELRLTEARAVLQAGTRRHPAAAALVDVLVDTLIDEAHLDPDRATELTATALKQLEAALPGQTALPAETLLRLGQLRESAGQSAAAVAAYQQVLNAKPSSLQKAKAQSRLVLLKLKQTAT